MNGDCPMDTRAFVKEVFSVCLCVLSRKQASVLSRKQAMK